jgi:hypothetical protein
LEPTELLSLLPALDVDAEPELLVSLAVELVPKLEVPPEAELKPP